MPLFTNVRRLAPVDVRVFVSKREETKKRPLSAFEGRVQGDLRLEELRDRATSLGLACQLLELGLGRPGDLGFQRQVNTGDGVAVGDLVERDLGAGLHAVGSKSGLAQDQG